MTAKLQLHLCQIVISGDVRGNMELRSFLIEAEASEVL